MKWGALAFVLFAFAAGGAFGFLIGNGSGSGGPVADLGGGASNAARTHPAARTPDREVYSSPGSAGGDVVPPRIGDLEIRDVPTGTGTITGVVRDDTGQPLAGVLVRATYRDTTNRRSYWLRGSGPPEDKELPEVLKAAAESYYYSKKARRDATTDANGTYTISGVGEGSWWLYAWLDGYELKRSQNGDVHPGDTVDFTAVALSTLTIKVLLPDGTEPDDAQIQCVRNRSTNTMPWRKDTPFVRVDPGVWKLRALGGEDNAYRSEEVEVTLDGKVKPEPITLQLADHPGIRGEVVFDGQEQNTSGHIYAAPAKSGDVPDLNELRRSRNQSYFYGSYQKKYAFHDLKPGTWCIAAVLYDGTMLASEIVEVADHMVQKDLKVPAATPDQYVVVSVQGPDGQPVTDASLSCMCVAPNRGSTNSSRVQKMPDGTYRVFHARWRNSREETPAGATYTIIANSPKYGTQSVEYVPGQTPGLTVRFEEPAWLEVTVSGLAGSDLEGQISLSLIATTEDGKRSRSYYGSGGSGQPKDGKVSFGPVAPGSYEVSMSLRDNRYSSNLGRFPLTLGPGKNTHAIALPALYSLTVSVPAGAEKTRVSLSSRNRTPNTASYHASVTLEGGKAVFDRVPAGDYQVYVYAQGGTSGRMQVTVPGPSVVEFAPMVVNALLVHVTDSNGGMAKAGLAEGDVVVGANGKEFKDEVQLRAAMTLAATEANARLSVIRGGRVREIVVADLKSIYPRGAGGSWESTSR